jgi:hypothetical protein
VQTALDLPVRVRMEASEELSDLFEARARVARMEDAA